MKQNSIEIPVIVDSLMSKREMLGQTVILCAIEGRMVTLWSLHCARFGFVIVL